MLLNNLMKAGAVADDKLMVEDVFATTLYTGTGASKYVTTGVSLSNSVSLYGKTLTSLGGAFNAGYLLSNLNDGIVETDNANNIAYVPTANGYFDVMVDLVNPATVVSYRLAPQGSGGTIVYNTPLNFSVKASSNGTDWTTVATFSNISTGFPAWNPGTFRAFSFSNTTPYRYWRLQFTSVSSNPEYGAALSEWEITTTDAQTCDGMIWLKSRSATTDHAIYDTVRGATYDLASNLTTAQTTQATGVTGFGTTGFSMGALAKINTSAATYAAWTFKKAPKFFDVVQVSHTNGSANTVTHSLGCAPGMVTAKATGGTSDWFTWHRGLTAGNNLSLNTYAVESTTNAYISVSGETVTFSSSAPTGTYIFYIWAHDDSVDGVIQCGSFTGTGGEDEINIGFEPQFLIVRSSTPIIDNWRMVDTMRGFNASSGVANLKANRDIVESVSTSGDISITNSGFKGNGNFGVATHIYLAIRRGPMRTPTDGAKVFAATAVTGTGTVAGDALQFPPDVLISAFRTIATGHYIWDRLRGKGTNSLSVLALSNTAPEATYTDNPQGFGQDGVIFPSGGTGWNTSGTTYSRLYFRRAPGFFDQVAYTGTGVARTIAHGLKSVPGMIWVKVRSNAYNWFVYHKSLGAQYVMLLNAIDYVSAPWPAAWNSTEPTESVFSVGTIGNVNASAATYVAYLFGDTAGLCKSGSYTGNGTNQDVSCGFAPRFIIIKRTDVQGDWRVFDQTRGIVSGSDPVLCLNTTAAEVTTSDPIDPIANGFNIAQETTNNLNVNGATYIFWASA